MARLTSISPETATGEAKTLLDAVAKKMGKAPNMTRAMAVQPAVLEGYLGFSGALAKGRLDAKTRAAIALAVAGVSGCDYCASAHSYVSGSLKVDQAEIDNRLAGRSDDPRIAAILTFAKAVVETRGQVSDAELAAVRSAGFDDADIGEVIANVALNSFTNLFNNVADTEIDFPRVSVRTPAIAA